MKRLTAASSSSSPLARQRTVGVVRSVLIGYGVAVLTYLFSRSSALNSAQGGEVGGLAQALVVGGLALQALLTAARALVKHRAPDSESAAQGLMILELVADGVTVLLFAWATLGAITHATSNV